MRRVVVAAARQVVHLSGLVAQRHVDAVGPYVRIDDRVAAGVRGEAAQRLEHRRLARAASPDDAVEVVAEMDPLVTEEASGEPQSPDDRYRPRHLLLDAHPRVGILEG